MQIVSTPPPGQPIGRQRMNKSGTYGGPAANPVTGWTSDASYPATIASNKLQVVGAGTVTVAAQVTANTYAYGGNITVTLYHNGVAIASDVWTGGTSTKTISATRTVAPGDLIHISSGTGYNQIVATNTWVEVVP